MYSSSNRSFPEILDFSFNGKSVPITISLKHLGVTFSNDAKLNTHFNNIKSSVSKHLNSLRKLKYRLSCTNLDKLYLVCIRPLFEYACELWDNCGIGNSQKLEQLTGSCQNCYRLTLWFIWFVPKKKFRTTRELEYLFFLSRKAQFFFPESNIRLYDKNSESDYYFFSSTKIRIFFSATLGIRIFF